MSLPRPVRMTRRREFEAVRLQGASSGGRLLALGLLPRPGAEVLQAGVIVPKALGSAPVRNRLKRRLREIIREALATLEQGPDRPALVTIARRASVGADFNTLRTEWRRLAGRAGLLPSGSPRPIPAPPSQAGPKRPPRP